jgi:hypothetical protein
MIIQLLRELQDTWGYDTTELNDIREKMEELANICYWDGHNEATQKANAQYHPSFTAYGKKEDWE